MSKNRQIVKMVAIFQKKRRKKFEERTWIFIQSTNNGGSGKECSETENVKAESENCNENT